MRTFRRRLAGVLAAATAVSAIQLTVAAPPAHAEDDMCYTAKASRSWYNGPSASVRYDQRTSFDTSRAIPKGLLDNRYVPQGMAALRNWNGTSEDILLISAYRDKDGDKHPDGPSAIFGVVASGTRKNKGLGYMLIEAGHVGGLAVYKGYVYVASEYQIRAFPVRQVKNALKGGSTGKIYKPQSRNKRSYKVGFLGSGGGYLWAGKFDDDSRTKANRYVQRSSSTTGQLRYTRTQIVAPKKTQGIAVTKNHVIFSTSYGRNNRSNIWVMRRGKQYLWDSNSYCFRAPSMTEGIVILNGRVWINYESRAYTYYRGTWWFDDPRNPIDRVHSMRVGSVTSLMSNAKDGD